MRRAKVFFKDQEAGILSQLDDSSFNFNYSDLWFADQTKPPICLAFPKSMREYFSKTLFPFFFNMLPEGINKRLLCAQLRLDESDYFGILLNTAKYDTIGAVTLSKLPDTP